MENENTAEGGNLRVLFLVGIIFIVGGIVLCVKVRPAILLASLVGVILVCISAISAVPTGYTGMLVTFGRVSDTCLDAGLCIRAPWQNVVLMDNRTQKSTQTTESFSSDSQQVDVTYSLNYSIDKGGSINLYRTVGTDYYDRIILPRAQENLKSVFAQYTADQLIANRGTLADSILALMKKDLTRSGVNVLSVSIENIDFTDVYITAVEQKQVAAQRKLQAQTEEEQKTMEAEAAAERSRIAAQAEADVVRIQAESAQYAGEREAEMNKKLAENLSAELVQYYSIQNWDGHLPSTMLGGASEVFPVIDIPHTIGNAE